MMKIMIKVETKMESMIKVLQRVKKANKRILDNELNQGEEDFAKSIKSKQENT